MPEVIAIDFETFYSKKLKYSLRTTIAEQYCKSHLFDPYMISASDGVNCWAGSPKDFDWTCLEGKTLLSHNCYSDSTVYEEMVRRGQAPQVKFAAWHCTANLTSFLCNRRALDHAVEYLFKVKLSKVTREDANNRHWPADFSSEAQQQMIEYAKRDAFWTWKIWDTYSAQWPDSERRLSQQTIAQGQRGVQIDVALLNDYLLKIHEMKAATEQTIPWIINAEDDVWEDFNAKPTSTKCIAEQCRLSGIPCCPVRSDDEEAYLEWEETYAPNHKWIYSVSAWRSVNKLYKTLQTVKERLRPDGTMPFALKYHGAHCLTGDAEVLTLKGWIPLAQWTSGDIAQWYPSSGRIKFLSATSNQFCVDEETKIADAPYFKGWFTLGHTMPYLTHGTFKHRVCKAQEFTARSTRWVPIGGRLERWELPANRITSLEMGLLVAVQADGCWERGEKSGGGLQFTLRKTRKIERLRQICKDLNIPTHDYKYPSSHKGQVSIRIRRGDCPNWLTPGRKIFGPWLLDSTPEALEEFVRQLCFWDGHEPTREYYSSIKANVEWASTICHLTGRSMLVREKPQQGNRQRHWAGVIRDTDKALVFSKKHVSTSPAKEHTVYCPTTQTGFFLFRYRGVIAITGNTGRWSGDAKINMQNMRKIPVLCNEHGLMEQSEKREVAAVKHKQQTGNWPEWVKFAVDFRKLIIARPGKKLIVSDLSQIEPRVLAWLCDDTEMLGLLNSGMSPYEAHARTTMGWAGGVLKDEDPGLYSLAKARVLALGYQAAWEKFISMALTQAQLDITVNDPEWIEERDPTTGEIVKVSGYGQFAKATVADFRANNPKISGDAGIWKKLDTAFKQSIGGDFKMTFPNGRQLKYEKVRCETRLEPDPKTKQPRRKCVFTAEVGGRRVQSYGGKLTENIVQGIARDIFATHLLAIDARYGDGTVLFSVHDEAVTEVDISVQACDIEAIMSECPAWMPGLPVQAEAKEVKCYQK